MANLNTLNYSGLLNEPQGTAPTITESSTILTTPFIMSGAQIVNADISQVDSVYTTSGKTVIVWAPYDSASKPNGQVATVTGDEISYGSATAVSGGGDGLQGVVVGYEQTENKVLACYRSGAGTPHQHTMVVGTVSGTSISWGTPAVLAAGLSGNYGDLGHTSMTWVGGIGGDTTNRLVISYAHADQANQKSKIAVLTISGTTPSRHAETSLGASTLSSQPNVIYIGGGKVVVAYSDGVGRSKVGTITGGGTNTIALGSNTTFSTGLIYSDQDVANDGTADKFVIAYFEGSSNALKLYARVGSVSGTTITYGTAVEIAGENQANYPRHMSLEYHEAAGKFLICYRKGGDDDTVLKSFSRSGDTITNVGSETVLRYNEGISQSCGNYDPLNKRVLFFRHPGTSSSRCNGGAADLLQSSMALDLSTGSYFAADLQNGGTSHISALTITESLASGTTQTLFLKTTQGTFAKRFMWDLITNVKWPGGWPDNSVTTDNAVDIFSFTTFDEGTTWYGKVEGINF